MRPLFFFIFLLLAASVFAANPIPSDHKITWTAGVEGGIPNVTTVNTILPSTATLTDINNAIAACPSNQVVVLTNGVYPITGQIVMKQGVVLRGAFTNNPDATVLRFDGNAATDGNIKIAGASFNDPNTTPPPNIVNWTAGFTKGTTVITLSSVAGLDSSKILVLDRLNDGIDVDPAGTEDNCTYCGRSSGGRVQMQGVKVVSISGTDVTISPGLYMTNWGSGGTPQAWWQGSCIEKVGIENLSVTNIAGSDHHITFFNARNCWLKNVNSFNAGAEHIRNYISHHIEVNHCYFYGTKNASSQSYGVNPYWSWDGLVVNNIFNKVTSPVVMEAGSEGWVVAYNYATNLFYQTAGWLIEGFAYHGAHVSYTLMEGNHTPNIYADVIHGSSSHNTAFRNRITGKEPTTTDNTRPQEIMRNNHYFNVVGNLFGTSGYHTNYVKHNGETFADGDHSIYVLGYATTSDTYPGTGVTAYDSRVETSLNRFINYDVTTSTNNGIILGGGFTTNDLVASYFYNSKPDWFGDRPWPPFDPTGTSATITDPTNIPAGFRFILGGLTNDPPSGADLTSPNITITFPTASPTYSSSSSTIDISGSASDNVLLSSVTWSCNTGGSGTCTGTTSWSQNGITLQPGVNIITVTATDSSSNTSTDTITVTYSDAVSGTKPSKKRGSIPLRVGIFR
jgi:hypothetical protein